MVKAVDQAFCSTKLETLVANPVSKTCSSHQMLDKTQTGVFPIIGFLVKPLINESCHNSRTGNDIDMRLGPISKPDKRNKATTKN